MNDLSLSRYKIGGTGLGKKIVFGFAYIDTKERLPNRQAVESISLDFGRGNEV